MAKKSKISALSSALVLPMATRFLAENPDWSPTRLGKVALNDPSKISRWRKGQPITDATAAKVVRVMDKAAPGFSRRFVLNYVREIVNAEAQ